MDDTAPPGPGGLRAAIFDTDGVITDTAEAHFRAWKAVFDTFLRSRGAPGEFTRADYLAQVDGVPRLDGVRGFLAGRGITLPEGAEGDDGLDTVRGLATVKNQRFTDWLAENRVPVFEDTLALIAALTSDGIAVGVFSSSRNAPRCSTVRACAVCSAQWSTASWRPSWGSNRNRRRGRSSNAPAGWAQHPPKRRCSRMRLRARRPARRAGSAWSSASTGRPAPPGAATPRAAGSGGRYRCP
ncbi:MAG: hypothetical protein JKP98_04760 [Rhodobacteraceae bacterium]|nr:hypothetical protein [Paracoccaceae bacterium]